MISARVRKSWSELAWYFSQIALTDSASMRAWAGSYTPHGRSQWASTTVRGVRRRGSRIEPSWVVCDDPQVPTLLSSREAGTDRTLVHGARPRAVHGPGAAPRRRRAGAA